MHSNERAPRIALIGRLTGPKGALARRLLREVFPRFPRVQFALVGGPVTDDVLRLAGHNVECLGWVANLEKLLESVDLVIGSGRVALEAMHAGVPVLAAGEARYLGFVTVESFPEARRTNFGDCDHGTRHDLGALAGDIGRFLAGYRPPLEHYPGLLGEYAGDRVAAAVNDVYADARIARRLARRSVPILCYHRVVTAPPKDSRVNIYITKDALASHLRQLHRRRMTPITFSDLLSAERLPERPVILSFDDGYRDNYEYLLPLLHDFAARAVIFVLGDRTLTSNRWDAAAGEPEAALMTDSELRRCHASGLVEIGAHGFSHRRLPELPDRELDREFAGSKQVLETIIEAPVRSFAYPYGAFGARERRRVAAAGFSFGVATDRGVPLERDRYAIARRLIFPATGNFGFYKKSSTWYSRYRHLCGRTA